MQLIIILTFGEGARLLFRSMKLMLKIITWLMFVFRTKRRTPNTATFVCKHLDTDSDQNTLEETNYPNHRMTEEKSLLVAGDADETLEPTESDTSCKLKSYKEEKSKKFESMVQREVKYFSAKMISRKKLFQAERQSSESIKELVDRAVELVRPKLDNCVKSVKTDRVRRWLEQDGVKPLLDSCDASGELTTEESDKESMTSEELDGSVATCRRSGSAEGILDEPPVSKTRRSAVRMRPWSFASDSHLFRSPNPKTRLSNSESALHQMASPSLKGRLKDFTCHTTGKLIRTLCTDENSSSGSSCLKRRRTRAKKRAVVSGKFKTRLK